MKPRPQGSTGSLKRFFTAQSLLAMAGYCLHSTVMLHSYTTAFAFADGAYGYISSLSLMAGGSIGTVTVSVALFMLARAGRLKSSSTPFRVPLIALAACYACSLLPLYPSDSVLFLLGLVWGCAVTSLAVCWMVILAREPSPVVLILQLVAALFVSSVTLGAMRALSPVVPTAGTVVFCLALLGACYAITVSCLDGSGEPEAPAIDNRAANDESSDAKQGGMTFIEALRQSVPLLLTWGFFDLIVGLINTYAYYGSQPSFTISATAPIESMLACSVLLVAFVAAASRVPNQSTLYVVILPLAIGVLMILPFFGEQFGASLSVALYITHSATTSLSNFWLLRVIHSAQRRAIALSAIALGGVRALLTIGIVSALALSSMRGGESFVRLGIVSAICIYGLVLLVVFWGFSNMRGKQRIIVIAESFEESRERTIRELAARHDLTARETDILASLARGNTARSIAEQLHISTSTVQWHMKSLYAKLGVHKKQQVLDLFEAAPHA